MICVKENKGYAEKLKSLNFLTKYIHKHIYHIPRHTHIHTKKADEIYE